MLSTENCKCLLQNNLPRFLKFLEKADRQNVFFFLVDRRYVFDGGPTRRWEDRDSEN